MERSITEACAECRHRFTMKIGNQMMAQLPKSRLQSSLRSFQKVGVDYGGPFLTKQGRGRTRAKRYLCLFTCLTTRAVHLEMSYSLDTDSFINAFTRMTSRRGTPTYVISDNGTNFIGAERELRELVEALDTDRITQETANITSLTGSLTLRVPPILVVYLRQKCEESNQSYPWRRRCYRRRASHSYLRRGTIVEFPTDNLRQLRSQ